MVHCFYETTKKELKIDITKWGLQLILEKGFICVVLRKWSKNLHPWGEVWYKRSISPRGKK